MLESDNNLCWGCIRRPLIATPAGLRAGHSTMWDGPVNQELKTLLEVALASDTTLTTSDKLQRLIRPCIQATASCGTAPSTRSWRRCWKAP